MKKHGYKRRVLSKRRRSSFSASIWAPILKLAGCIAGVLAALGILTLLIMIVLEGVFKIDTPLRPDGFLGKAARLVKIELPLIESPTPYIPPEPTPTPKPEPEPEPTPEPTPTPGKDDKTPGTDKNDKTSGTDKNDKTSGTGKDNKNPGKGTTTTTPAKDSSKVVPTGDSTEGMMVVLCRMPAAAGVIVIRKKSAEK